MKKFIVSSLLLSLALFGTAKAYTVVSGDNLTKIAQKASISLSELIKLNSHIKNPNLIFPGQNIVTGREFGIPEVLGAAGTLPIAGVTYTLAGSGITGSAASITLQSLTVPQTGYELVDSDFSDTFYITLEPGNTKRQEIVSCTTVAQNANNTATLSGCSRGLLPFSPYTASSTYQFSHAGGTQAIFSDPPQLFNEFTAKSNAETITKVWTFEQHPLASSTLASPTSTYQYITKQYADNLSFAGSPTSTESTSGRVKLGTQTQMASSTYDASDPTIVYTRYTTSTPGTSGKYVPVTENDGKLNQTFIDLTDSFTWTGLHNFNSGFISNSSSTLTASTTFTGDVLGLKTLSNFVTSTGEAIDGSSTPQAVAITTTTGNYLKADGNDPVRVQFVGFITSNASNGTQPTVITNGVVSGFSALTPGANYYVSDTAGSIATTPGTTVIPVGRALTATKLLVEKGRKVASGTIAHSAGAGVTQDSVVTIGFKYSVLITSFSINGRKDAVDFPSEGVAVFQGTTLQSSSAIESDDDATAITSSNIQTLVTQNDLQTHTGLAGTDRSYSTWSINAVGNDSFTSRFVNTIVGGSSGQTTAGTIYYTAIE